ncbi:MAG: translation initiation factor IF-2 [Planctomycetaceae bacterium]
MKVRIFALAKDLGMDSKVLIQHCNDAGIPVKNSALASITPAERDVVLRHLGDVGSSVSSGSTPPASPEGPVRDPVSPGGGKIRQIQTLGPLSRAMRRGRDDSETAIAEPLTQEPPSEPAESHTLSAEAADTDVEPAVAIAAETEERDDEGGAEPAIELNSGSAKPITKEDYVSPVGTTSSVIREMKPRASISDNGGKSSRKAAKKSSLPSIAPLPNYRPPSPSKGRSEPAAQKPDLPLTAEALRQNSPLASILRKNAETRKRDDESQEVGRRPGARPGRLGLDDVRQQRRVKRTRSRREEEDAAESQRIARRTVRRQRRVGSTELKTSATVEVPLSIRALSEVLGRPVKDIQGVLYRAGKMLTINSELDEESVLEIGLDLGVDITIQHEADFEDELTSRVENLEIPEGATIAERPPIVTILGHVDHGKTTLLDTIRSANVAAGEAGGITQHISSYQIVHHGKPITFEDTPGHEAFGEMRARGANVTEIIVLVVAADDGVMPQTAECISHAKAAGAPLIVAMNKCDLPDINEQKVLADLSQHDVLPAEWGGDVEVVRISALKGTGIDKLLETILLTAELHELASPTDTPAVGICLEAFRDEGRGPLAWVIVRNGTLHVGDVMLCGPAFGRIRAIYNDRDEELQSAPPSLPVRVAGLNAVPGAGDHFYVMGDLDEAREAAETRQTRGRDAVLAGRGGGRRTLEEILAGGVSGGVRELPLVIKADSPGSLEALRSELGKFKHDEVRVKVLHEGVGGVNESDVYLASSTGAIVIAFHVIAEDRATSLAEREGVEIRRYNIIYEVTDHIRLALEGLLRPDRVEVATGRALVLRTFHISRFGTIAGCRVLNGTIERNNRIHVIRDQKILNDYPIASLKREKDDVREVREGYECGIRLDGFNDVKEGDLLEAFRIDEIKRTLEG